MSRKSKYTNGQKKAYYSGMGYRAGRCSKEIPFKNKSNKDSFRAGYRAAMKVIEKYPDLKK